MELANKKLNQQYSNGNGFFKKIGDAIGDAAAAVDPTVLARQAAEAAQKVIDDAKALSDRIEAAAKKAAQDLKDKLAKIDLTNKNSVLRKKLRDLTGKAKKGAMKLLRKAILKRVATTIRLNVHGVASRLYPGITSDADAKAKKYKKTFIPKARATYADVLSEWTSLGGTKAGLDDVIYKGSKVKFHLFSGVEGDSGTTNDEDYVPNIPESEETKTVDYNTEAPTQEEVDDMAAQGADTAADAEEKVKGFKAFWLKLMSLFKKNKGDENPFDEGTPENENTTELPDGEDTSNDSIIPGISKPVFWGGTTVLAIGATLLVLWKTGIIFKK